MEKIIQQTNEEKRLFSEIINERIQKTETKMTTDQLFEKLSKMSLTEEQSKTFKEIKDEIIDIHKERKQRWKARENDEKYEPDNDSYYIGTDEDKEYSPIKHGLEIRKRYNRIENKINSLYNDVMKNTLSKQNNQNIDENR